MFVRGETERYRLSAKDLARAESLVEIAAEGKRAADDIGSLLKLIHVLQTKRSSPSLAAELSALLRASKRAKAIIHLHWSTPEEKRGNIVMRAPHIEAEVPAASIKVATFLVPRRRLA